MWTHQEICAVGSWLFLNHVETLWGNNKSIYPKNTLVNILQMQPTIFLTKHLGNIGQTTYKIICDNVIDINIIFYFIKIVTYDF